MKHLYLTKSAANLPKLYEKTIKSETPAYILSSGDLAVVDLGNHYAGYFSFKLNCVDAYIDAPVKLYIKFCETEKELDDDFSEYRGLLCSSWLQEETINIDFPGEYKMPRRYAARFIKIEVVATSQKILLSDFCFNAVTSADVNKLTGLETSDKELKIIDSISTNTLKNCMQRVFEDGPKRDRRLWIGDFYLEALTNYYTFDNMSIVRRCLYLFAAAETNDKGFLPAYIYENPEYVSGTWFLMDYAMLFVATACDYYTHTGDSAIFNELYPVIKQQMDAAESALDCDGIISIPQGCDVFIDWCEELGRITSLHGIYMYVLKKLVEALDKTDRNDKEIFVNRYQTARNNALGVLYNSEIQAFVNTKDNFQYSVHSAVWMVLGGAVTGDAGRKILLDAINSADSIKPFTPYMHHYLTQALVELGLLNEAKDYIKKYWGGMVDLGADTFFEVYVPDNPDFSPYKDRMANSMCHAWSCTPAYFIRKYFNNI